jgi:hypothetical protein
MEKAATIESIMYSRSGSFGLARWLFRDPQERWKRREIGTLKRAQKAENHLTKRGGKIIKHLNPRFAIGKDNKNNTFLYSLSARFWHASIPFASIDYARPEHIRQKRIAIESTYAMSQLITSNLPIPYLGTGLSQIFAAMAETPMHHVQRWEARLMAHLITRIAAGESHWNYELHLLYRQMINPFEISPAQAFQLAEWRRQKYSIPSYQLTHPTQ